MKTDIIEILNKAEFTKEFIAYIEKEFPRKFKDEFINPFHSDVNDNPLLNLGAKERLFFSLAEILELKDYYLNKGIPLGYLYTSIYDLSYRLERYYKNHGVYGISDRDLKWLAPLFKAEIFDLGSLRFQRFWFSNKEIERESYDYMLLDDKWKQRFPEGSPVITIHILKDTDLRPEKIDEALKTARLFFDNYFSEHNYEIFVCRTWLLYPKTRDILSENSNISVFAKRFKIIATNKNSKQALDRVYGTSDLKEIEAMPKNSSLEQIAYKNSDKLGVAAGIIYK